MQVKLGPAAHVGLADGTAVVGLEVGNFVDGFDDEGFDEGAEVVEHGGSTRQEKGLILSLNK